MPRVDVLELCGRSRVSRADAVKLRESIEAAWHEPDVIEIDFGGVTIASVSFLDEALGLLAKKYPLEVIRKRLKVSRITEQDRKLLNSIMSSRARERDNHLWSGVVGEHTWVADVLWDDGSLLGLRIAPEGSDFQGESAWWDYGLLDFFHWDPAIVPTEVLDKVHEELVRREQKILAQQRKLIEKARAASQDVAESSKTVTLQLETQEEVDAARRLARTGHAMVTGRVAILQTELASPRS